jgi:hypothetical protein
MGARLLVERVWPHYAAGDEIDTVAGRRTLALNFRHQSWPTAIGRQRHPHKSRELTHNCLFLTSVVGNKYKVWCNFHSIIIITAKKNLVVNNNNDSYDTLITNLKVQNYLITNIIRLSEFSCIVCWRCSNLSANTSAGNFRVNSNCNDCRNVGKSSTDDAAQPRKRKL